MHGMLKVEDAKLLATEGVSVEKADVGTAVAEEAASDEGQRGISTCGTHVPPGHSSSPPRH